MDWYLPEGDPSALQALRREVREYLVRHAEIGTDPADAEMVVDELVANSVRHATGPVWVQLSWLTDQPELTVHDLGPGFSLPAGVPTPPVPAQRLDLTDGAAAPYPEMMPDALAESGRGLYLVTHLAGYLDVAHRRGGGARVHATLPIRRAASPTFEPQPMSVHRLPLLSEARPEGGFNRESFLRALVVQLSQVVERMHGPAAAEAAVSQVGIEVGAQMQEEFRIAMGLDGPLTPAQLAECFVRLKHAIDGRFYVVEVTDDHIVLGNHRCPFGNAVQASPALCRMTSSVFGGIAAQHNPDGASVVLEERIAIGDPGCRVVVHLGPAPDSASRFAHRYVPPAQRGSQTTQA